MKKDRKNHWTNQAPNKEQKNYSLLNHKQNQILKKLTQKKFLESDQQKIPSRPNKPLIHSRLKSHSYGVHRVLIQRTPWMYLKENPTAQNRYSLYKPTHQRNSIHRHETHRPRCSTLKYFETHFRLRLQSTNFYPNIGWIDSLSKSHKKTHTQKRLSHIEEKKIQHSRCYLLASKLHCRRQPTWRRFARRRARDSPEERWGCSKVFSGKT